MDASGIFEAHALGLQAGVIVALALALAAALAQARARSEAQAAAAASRIEALNDEVWRLKEAAEARDRADAAMQAKPRFLATMSHEIRTPVCGILGLAEHLRHAALSPENASYVEAICESGAALIALIDQILDLSRIEAGHFGLAVETVDVVKLVEGVVELLALRAQSKGLEIAASVSGRTPQWLRTDPMRLRQVLMNLAGNAIKFTSRGGVCVAVDVVDRAARFSVMDTGPGVPEDRRAAIFQDFERGDGPDAPGLEGAGLGLAISRKLVGLMGGELTVTDNPGGGSIFAFSIPLPAIESGPPSGTAESALKGTRALIIANSPFEAPAIAARLAEAGAKVERAEGLEPGLAALRRNTTPDLVIVDCALGPEATNRLAGEARAAGTQRSLVLFSPFERRTFGQMSLQGFDGWLVKPVRIRSLFERLDAAFPQRRNEASERAAGAARRALLVEDDDLNALIAQKALRQLGFEVTRVTDGGAALRLAAPAAPGASPTYGVILMDVRLDGLDGHEAARRLRQREAECGAPPAAMVAMTASGLDEDRTASMAAGFDAFLMKPFEFQDLKRAIDRACRAPARADVAARAS